MPITRVTRFAAITVIIVGLLVCPYTLLCEEAVGKSPDYKQLRLFRQVMDIVQKNYVKEVPDTELIQAAIKGMVQNLDPHSSFLTEDEFKELQVETKGEFGGLGIEITLENGVLTIVSPIEDTPAFKEGLKAGDRITEIDGETTKNMKLHDAVKKMRGPKGTKVVLKIMRKGFLKPETFTIVRDIIHVRSVKKQVLEKGYPYIRVAHFQENTDVDLIEAIKEFGGDEEIKGLILDLRLNPGGLLDQAFKVANLFLDKGLIVYTDGRVKDSRMHFSATQGGPHYKFKLAVLINEGSASASEIVAGALQDHDRALVVGTKSFGKASVQTIIPLENGSGLRLTTAYYYTPKGRHIQTGIEPDVDLKKEIEQQEEAELREELIKKDKKSNRSRFRERQIDPQKDIAVKAALQWLHSSKSVEEYKQEHQKPLADTAWYMKEDRQ